MTQQPNMPRYRHDHFIEASYDDGVVRLGPCKFPPEYERELMAEGWRDFQRTTVAWWTSERNLYGLRPEQEYWVGPFKTLREACIYWSEFGIDPWTGERKDRDYVAGITNQEPQRWPLNTGRLTLWQSWFWRGFSTLWRSLLDSLRSDRELQFYCFVGIVGLIAAIIVYGRMPW